MSKVSNEELFYKVCESRDFYLLEAKQCASKGLYFAGCILLGSYLEASLIGWISAYSDPNLSVNDIDKAHWRLANYIDLFKDSGWLDDCNNQELLAIALHEIRNIRNYIHPIKWAKNKLMKIKKKDWKKHYNTLAEFCDVVERNA